jgi:signal transduction histidine kinase/HPt (histidine-containing phosphotransfer) domain-containing protein
MTSLPELPTSEKLRWSISRRILLSFLLLIIISGTITAFNILALQDFFHQFSRYHRVSANTNLMLKIDKDVSDLQRAILAFSNTEKITSLAQLHELHEKLSADIAMLIGQEQEPTYQETLKKIQQLVASFKEKIETIASERKDREQLINVELATAYIQTNEEIAALFKQSSALKNERVMNLLWQAQNNIYLAENASSYYFSKHDARIKQQFILNLSTAITALNAQNDSHFNNIQQLLTRSQQLFHQAAQADRNYLFLVNVVIAGESSELSELSDRLKSDYLTIQQNVFSATDERIRNNQRIAIIVSLIGAILAMFVAVITGNRISAPLKSITDTFSRLVRGENLTEIPGVNRNDEIGSLAKAANVFHQNNVQTKDLLNQTNLFAEQLKAREQALEQAVIKAQDANLAKSQFLANMSHELRTPMNAILGMLALLQKTELNSRQADYTQKTEGAARSLLSLLNDILDLSKAEAGKMELDPTPFNLDRLLNNLRTILETNLSHKTAELCFSVAANLPREYLGDSMRLQQILINLGGNAIKFTQHGTITIAVTLTAENDKYKTLCFKVTDTGIGIAPDNQAKIFSGFTQAESSTTRRFGGTGLGLSISQRLVNLMGGSLSVVSELGKGSCFSFSIELPTLAAIESADLAASFEKATSHKSHKLLAGIHILLVEDNLTNQQIAFELLTEEGAIIELANHGQEALDILSARHSSAHGLDIDVVLMDLQMPVMDGISATKAIRQQLMLTHLPIVAMTANAMASDREECINAGMNDHIGKPFELAQLIQVILQWSGTHKQPSTTTLPTHKIDSLDTIAQRPLSQIDLNAAIARMGGNRDLYARMLPKFSANLDALPERLETLLNANDFTAIAKELHTLKGLAGTMGFTALFEYAATAEKHFKAEIGPVEASNFIREGTQLIRASIGELQELQTRL